MAMCGWTRVLVPAMLAAVAASFASGSDLVGWVAGIATAAAFAAALRWSGRVGSCDVGARRPQ